jgi:REP element-mobilizing transposase RayT
LFAITYFSTISRGMSRQRRFLSYGESALYHCVSRTTGGDFLFGAAEKDIMQRHLHQVAEFSGVEIVTYAVMSNHFHLLVRVPSQRDVTDGELLRRYRVLHPQPTPYVLARLAVMESVFKKGGVAAQVERNELLRRMGNLSAFMKLFKQRFSIWYNRHHNRKGTLWSERFSSTIVQGDRFVAALSVASYIDLNPVRAGMVHDPKDYRWCGYAEAVSTGGKIAKNLCSSVGMLAMNRTETETLAAYRMALFGKGGSTKRGDSKAAVILQELCEQVDREGGELPLGENLMRRIPCYTRGGVVGSEEFVNEHLRKYRTETRQRLRSGIRPLQKIEANVGDGNGAEGTTAADRVGDEGQAAVVRKNAQSARKVVTTPVLYTLRGKA